MKHQSEKRIAFIQQQRASYLTEEEKLFAEYQEKTGGEEPIGYIAPYGLPEGVEEHGGIAAVYRECIDKGITWETLLDYHEPSGDMIV